MNHAPGISDNDLLEEGNALFNPDAKGVRQKYETLSPEVFLERVRNADRILENCRKSLKGV